MADDHELTEEQFQSVYGPVAPLSPTQARDLLAGAPFRWWIVGGWSTELESKPRRQHTDLELSVARDDLDVLRAWLPDHHFWDIHHGTLTFLAAGQGLADEAHEQVWVRRDSYSPWILDLLLTPVEADTWPYKRDRRLTMPMNELIVERDGVRYQRPEIALLFKARRRASRDEEDFDAIVPMLSAEERRWLREAIALTEPADNPWLARL